MKTILVIEDQPDMRENIAIILEMEGFAVLAAENGRAGIGLAREDKPDLILCDVMMPEMDGYEVLRELRRDRTISGTPFIFLTARGEKRDQRDGMNLGADDYLTKPVTRADLLGAVRSRLCREKHRAAGFAPDFSSAAPLEKKGLTPREAEVLLWLAQGKSNPEIAAIIGCADNTIRVHLSRVFEKLGADNRHAASMIALELLAGCE
ncbi:MAG: response regulator transcription factor [Verrucomicrobiaceae bacterium]|nr:response regulator transcription factor [Verrucomicrobiaceae bacterium]